MPIDNKPQYLSSITIIRSLAALLVCLPHINIDVALNSSDMVNHLIRIGGVGVYMFFIISGFVIPYSLYKTNYVFNGFKWYFLKRSIRIDIPYWFAISSCFVFLPEVVSSVKFHDVIYHIFYIVPFIKDAYWFNGVFWTLSVEMQFYLLIGLLYPLLMKINTKISNPIIVVVSLFCTYIDQSHRGIFFNNITYFAIGFIAFQAYVEKTSVKVAIFWIAILTLYIVVEISLRIGFFVSATTLAILFLKLEQTPKVFNFLGRISYSLYLMHYPISHFFVKYFERFIPNRHILFTATLLICIISAYGFYLMIERPSIKLSKDFKALYQLKITGHLDAKKIMSYSDSLKPV